MEKSCIINTLVDRDCVYLDGSCKCEYPTTDCKHTQFRIRRVFGNTVDYLSEEDKK